MVYNILKAGALVSCILVIPEFGPAFTITILLRSANRRLFRETCCASGTAFYSGVAENSIRCQLATISPILNASASSQLASY
ncbi:hypothetical protein HD806DRAFT_123842 [Xylariaceae sp. AK1471]|nr:hypothetical protein HD806DRAFT_123842 [Xylariaceae sp. AK1471]